MYNIDPAVSHVCKSHLSKSQIQKTNMGEKDNNKIIMVSHEIYVVFMLMFIFAYQLCIVNFDNPSLLHYCFRNIVTQFLVAKLFYLQYL